MHPILLMFFAVSGFTGLIYESVWSHYLKLFLGHAAYAQSLVLAIFMGGMAFGSWIASRYTARWRNPLLGYAIVEAAVGLMALCFHWVFQHFTDLAYNAIFPYLASAAAVHTFKWIAAALLILPQSVLLGMTFPLISAGLIRLAPTSPGATLAMLYFANSIGAAAGAPVSGFILIDKVGLPGTILTAGLLNIVLALFVWVLVKDRAARAPVAAVAATGHLRPAWHFGLLAAALLTGAASLIYEVSWIRMLSLVLGSSTHAFELMLSAFILGLALGGLWIRSRLDRIQHPLRALAYIQIAMGVMAMATLPLYGQSFEFMQWMLQALAKSDGGYFLFNLLSHAIALAVMLPATFAAGMTLPLITYALIRQDVGEKSIGQVYAVNTLGSILGVVIAVHIGLPYLGLKGSALLGAAIDMGLGMALLWAIRAHIPRKVRVALPAFALAALVAVAAGVSLDSYKMASGVYRFGRLLSPEHAQILYHKDGKTATVDLVRRDTGLVSISTNGKIDAAMFLDPRLPATNDDEWTAVLAAVIPLATLPAAKTAANIGIGSGLTSHVLLQAPWLARVDTIEIEPAMVEAASGFGVKVQSVFTDPRSHIYIEDAKTFFSAHNAKYDIIVSEPSNPWVSGVANLFSEEFYRMVRRHLNKDGVLVQWLQLYEIGDNALASAIKAIDKNFAGFTVYFTTKNEMLILATDRENMDLSTTDVFRTPALQAILQRLSVHGIDDLKLHRIGSHRTLRPYFSSYPAPINSDYFPFLDLNATRTRYLHAFAVDTANLANAPVPILEMLERQPRRGTTATKAVPPFSPRMNTWVATRLRDHFTGSGRLTADDLPLDIALNLQLVSTLMAAGKCANPLFVETFYAVAAKMLPYLSPQELRRVWAAMGLQQCKTKLDANSRQWLELAEATADRDAKRMAKLGSAALAGNDASPMLREFALAAAMTGHIVAADYSDAATLWERYGGDAPAFNSSMFRLLRAQLATGLR